MFMMIDCLHIFHLQIPNEIVLPASTDWEGEEVG